MIKKILFFLIVFFYTKTILAQVNVDFNNKELITSLGKFNLPYKIDQLLINAPDLKMAFEKEKSEIAKGSKVFYFAEAIPVKIDILNNINWIKKGVYSYGKYTIKSNLAKSLSIKFSDFNLPKGTEMYIYNKDGSMITGTITENQNNSNKSWVSSVYKGDEVNIEVKIYSNEIKNLKLTISNISYGYKSIFIEKIGGFGLAGPCQINVLCPQGNNWVNERNSIVHLLIANQTAFGSGSLIMNTCGSNIPYILTANHVYTADTDVSDWGIFFQAWSPTCATSQNSSGLQFNGASLKANWAETDFCLVKLNETPATSPLILSSVLLSYSGWSRSTIGPNSGASIHHPSGDVMKISTFSFPVFRSNNTTWNIGGQIITPQGTKHWLVQWPTSINGTPTNGVTEGGSSGSPLYDQNRRIIGQLCGGPSNCNRTSIKQDVYGRFDDSWEGGGTSSSRLKDWLDPSNSGALFTNTTNILSLNPTAISQYLTITGATDICSQSTYSLTYLPPNSSIIWSISDPNIATVTSSGNQAIVTPLIFGQPVLLTATVYLNNIPFSCVQPSIVNFLIRPLQNNILTTPQNMSVCYDDYYNLEYPKPISLVYCPSNGIVTWDVPLEFNGDYTINGNTLTLNSGPNYEILQINPLQISASVFDPTTGNTSTAYTNFWTQSCFGFKNQNIIISPNPSNGIFKVSLQNKDKNLNIKEIKIKSKMGVPLFYKKYNDNLKSQTIYLQNFSRDMYFIEIFDGKIWHSQKLNIL